MPLNFPNSPSLNDTYTLGNKTWIWNGAAWQLKSDGAINDIPIGNSSPSTGAFTTLNATGTFTGTTIEAATIGNSGATLTGTLSTAAQTNITSVGTLAALTVTGNISTGGILTDGYYYANGSPFSSGGGTTTVSNTAPSSPSQGDIWINSDSGIQFIYFNDGDSNQWAEMEAFESYSAGAAWDFNGTDTATLDYDGVVNGNLTIGTGGVLTGITIEADTIGNSGAKFYTSTNSDNSDYKIPFVKHTGTTSGAYESLIDSGATFTYNPSTNTLTAGTFSGTATQAQYADLAENFETDEFIEPGTVVMFVGDSKIALCDEDMSTRVAGIVSTNPAYLMNKDQQGVPLALAGRVPTKVVGDVNPGDLLVSAGHGRARAEQNPKLGTIIGKAMEQHRGEEGVILVLALLM